MEKIRGDHIFRCGSENLKIYYVKNMAKFQIFRYENWSPKSLDLGVKKTSKLKR